MPHPRQTPPGPGTDISALLRTEIDLSPKAKEAWDRLAPATRRAVADALDDVESFTGTASVELGWHRPPLSLRSRPRLTIRAQDSGWSATRHVIIIGDGGLSHARDTGGTIVLDEGETSERRILVALQRLRGLALLPEQEETAILEAAWSDDAVPCIEDEHMAHHTATSPDAAHNAVLAREALLGMVGDYATGPMRPVVARAAEHLRAVPEGFYAYAEGNLDTKPARRIVIGVPGGPTNDAEGESPHVRVCVERTRVMSVVTSDEEVRTVIGDLTTRDLLGRLAEIPGVVLFTEEPDEAGPATVESVMASLTGGRGYPGPGHHLMPGPTPVFVAVVHGVLTRMKSLDAFEVSFVEDSLAVFTIDAGDGSPSHRVTVDETGVSWSSRDTVSGRRRLHLEGNGDFDACAQLLDAVAAMGR